jgi:hypothetical protein
MYENHTLSLYYLKDVFGQKQLVKLTLKVKI